MIKRLSFLLLLLTLPSYAARCGIVVFPLVNQLSDPLGDWVAAAVPEYFSRKLSAIEGVRIWDPLFMFQTDSTGWTMQSDSALLLHRSRWQWDAAMGGRFTVKDDSMHIALCIVWVSGTRQQVRMDIARSAPLSGCAQLCAALVQQTCALLHLPLTEKDSLSIRQEPGVSLHAYRTYWAGYGFEMAGNYSEAQTAYNRSIELAPSFTLARCRSGGIYLLTGNMEQARGVFRRAMADKRQTPLTRAKIADFAVDRLRPDDAFRFIDASRAELEKSAAGLTVIGKQYCTAGEYQRAIAAFRRAIAWGPDNLDAEFLLGMTYLWSGEYGAAIDLFNRLISIRPGYVRYHVSLGAVYRKAGRLMESLAVLDAVKKKEPENSMVLIEMAHTCFELTWYRKAGQLLEQARRLKPDQIEILVDLGIVYWHENRFGDAERCFKQAGRRSRGKQASLVNNGTMALLSGDVEKAIAAYRKADKLMGNNPTILYNLAVAYLKQGNKKAAARYFDALLLLTPGRIDLLIQRAILAQELGRIDDARIAYRRILENDPYHEAATGGLVKILLSQGAAEEAISRIETYLEAMPARGDFMVLLADAYRTRGWYEVAVEKYRMVVHEFPDYPAGYLGVGRCMYDMIRNKGSKLYDETLYALKQASGHAPGDPEPYLLMGDIYMEYKGYRDMAIEQWRTALQKTGNEREKRDIERKISAAGRR
ncbi:MAG: tetratricopeptide repeat protein [Chitinispirillaceae bacterium]|nr:tetratricopeptide repeat protein [Chitinispirillaceae bacterium]